MLGIVRMFYLMIIFKVENPKVHQNSNIKIERHQPVTPRHQGNMIKRSDEELELQGSANNEIRVRWPLMYVADIIFVKILL